MNNNKITKYTRSIPVYLCVGLVLALFASCAKDKAATPTTAAATGPYVGLPTGAEAALTPIYNANGAQAYTVDEVTESGNDTPLTGWAGLIVTLTPVNGTAGGTAARISYTSQGPTETVPAANRRVFPATGQFRIDSATGTTLSVTRLSASGTVETGFSAGTVSLTGTTLTFTFTIAPEASSQLNGATSGTFTFTFTRNAAS